MNIYISLFLLAWLLSLVGYLWLAIVAFKRSVVWGVLVLLLSPITAIIYSLMNWFDARKAFLVYIVSFLLCTGSAVYIYGEVGMGNMQQISARMHDGKLAPARAYQLILKGLNHTGSTDLFAEDTTSPSIDANQTKPAASQGTATPVAAKTATNLAQGQDQAAFAATNKPTAKTQDASKPTVSQASAKPEPAPADKTASKDASDVTEDTQKEKPPVRIPNPDTVPPDPLAQKPKKPEPNTIVVRMEKVPNYIGHYFIITLKSGSQQRGLLRKVSDNHLILDRKLFGGNFQYKIRKTQIKSIHMMTRLPDER